MRAIPSVLAPLVFLITSVSFLTAPVSVAAAQNVCVHAADGAIVCGPVANRGNNSTPNPFDRPGVAQPITPSPPAVEPKPVQGRTARESERNVRPPKHVYRPALPRELERHPQRRITREAAQRLHAERDRRPPSLVEREPPAHYSAADLRRHERERERALTRAKREHTARRYADRGPPTPPRIYRERPVHFADLERRMRELERELRALRVDRDEAVRRAERRDADRRSYRKPPPRYRERETRHEGERSAIGQRVSNRHVNRDRQPADD